MIESSERRIQDVNYESRETESNNSGLLCSSKRRHPLQNGPAKIIALGSSPPEARTLDLCTQEPVTCFKTTGRSSIPCLRTKQGSYTELQAFLKAKARKEVNEPSGSPLETTVIFFADYVQDNQILLK
jgi:hypothetical protein